MYTPSTLTSDLVLYGNFIPLEEIYIIFFSVNNAYDNYRYEAWDELGNSALNNPNGYEYPVHYGTGYYVIKFMPIFEVIELIIHNQKTNASAYIDDYDGIKKVYNFDEERWYDGEGDATHQAVIYSIDFLNIVSMCDETGDTRQVPIDLWNVTLQDAYLALDPEAQALLTNANPGQTGLNPGITWALYRYEYICWKYRNSSTPYNNFMNRHFYFGPLNDLNNDLNNNLFIMVIMSLLTLTLLLLYRLNNKKVKVH